MRLRRFGPVEVREEQRQLDVLRGRQHRDQVVGLEDETDVAGAPLRQRLARLGGDVDAVHVHRSGGRLIQPAQDVQQRRLAGAARAHERDEFAAFDVEAETPEHVNFLTAAVVAFVEIPCFDQRLGAAVAV